MLPSPAPQKFNTFNIFTTFAMFAIFAKFANFEPALEHPTPIHRHAPRPIRSRPAFPTPHPPLPAPTGRVPFGWRAEGEGRPGQRGAGTPPQSSWSLITWTGS
jgi:hypothetical protein